MGIRCHRRLGKQTISRHKKGLDKICEQCLHYQLIKGAGSSNHWDLSRLDQPRRPGACACISCCHPSSPAIHISVQAVLCWEAGAFQALLASSKPHPWLCRWPEAVQPPESLHRCRAGVVFSVMSEPAGLLLGFGWLKLLNGAAPTEGEGN